MFFCSWALCRWSVSTSRPDHACVCSTSLRDLWSRTVLFHACAVSALVHRRRRLRERRKLLLPRAACGNYVALLRSSPFHELCVAGSPVHCPRTVAAASPNPHELAMIPSVRCVSIISFWTLWFRQGSCHLRDACLRHQALLVCTECLPRPGACPPRCQMVFRIPLFSLPQLPRP